MSRSRCGPRYRAAIFDFYGTLARAVRWGPTVEEVLGRWGLELAEAAAEEWRSEPVRGSEHLARSASRDAYVAWERDRLRRLAVACGASEGPGGDADAVMADLYATTKDFDLEAYPEVFEVLATLAARGVVVAVCSNWDWDLDRALEQAGLAGQVDVAVTSARAGARKPHPRIFATTLETVGVAAADALFAGDNWHPDVEGPRTAGMDAVHVVREDAPPTEVPPLPDGVRRMADLRGILDVV